MTTLCPYDNSTRVVRFGHQSGRQMYFCRDCKRKFRGFETVDEQSLFKMKYPLRTITEVLTLYFNGMSFRNLSASYDDLAHKSIPKMTLWRWVIDFSEHVNRYVNTLRPQLGQVWYADETVVKIFGENWWFWDIIDQKTRFLVASHLSKGRDIYKATQLFRQAISVSERMPRIIITDKLNAYKPAIGNAFSKVYGTVPIHLTSHGFDSPTNINLIERFHGTVRQRTKVLKGFKHPYSASIILDGFTVHYNFFMEHSHLNGITPASAAGIGKNIHDWGDLIRLASQTRLPFKASRAVRRVRKNPINVLPPEWRGK